jgi:4-hydroxybenzoate polyprenyltransferase
MESTAALVTVRSLAPWVSLFRPRQWVKNGFVVSPLLFSGLARDLPSIVRSFLAFAAFCCAASAVYAFNDVADRAADRNHPTKRLRPVASGQIPVRGALIGAAAFLVLAVVLASALPAGFVAIVAGYLVLNVLYSAWLKRVVLVDVFVIASFFLFRLVGGSVAIAVRPSVWLLLCGGLLALYLGFAKRRHELVLLQDRSGEHRGVLAQYDVGLLDQIAAVLLAVTLVAYIMYTLSGTHSTGETVPLVFSVVFVLYGVLRYLYLVHGHGQGDPSETLLADRPLLAAIGLWVLYCGWALYG